MRNPVLILTHNCLELTAKCLESARNQDINVDPFIIDNGSTDGTKEWLKEEFLKRPLDWVEWDSNKGVSKSWNWGISYLFRVYKFDHVLVINNDTILPTFFYRHLLTYPQPFVTGISVDKMIQIQTEPPLGMPVVPHPDFSAFLVRREAWEKIGLFDESMVHYCSDNDWHVRGHKAGVSMVNSGVPFYHERSSTIKNAGAGRREIEIQADADRVRFREKWGCVPWEPGYSDLFR